MTVFVIPEKAGIHVVILSTAEGTQYKTVIPRPKAGVLPGVVLAGFSAGRLTAEPQRGVGKEFPHAVGVTG